MTQQQLPPDLDFLSGDPEPVQPQSAPHDSADVLPQAEADALLALEGVDGAWIETDTQGRRVVVLHYSRPDPPSHLPTQVRGLPVRVVGGGPIRAGG